MKKYIYNNVQGLVAVAIAITLSGAFSSCRDHDFDFEEHRYGTQEQIYNKTFTDTFGEIDPEHTWIPFVDADVTVSVSQPSDIKVFDCNGQLVAHREEVSGTQTIEFDVPRGENNIIVLQNDIYAVEAMVGESVSFEGTRTQYDSKDGVEITYSTNTKDYSRDNITGIADRNNPALQNDFSFVSNGNTFTIYPIYWKTSNTLECGVYYIGASGNLVYVPVYKNKNGNEILKGQKKSGSWETITGNYSTTYSYSNSYTNYQTSGIDITLRDGIVFGLYIKEGNNYYHSRSDHNTCGNAHAALYSYNQKDYISFEDSESSNPTFKNIVFAIESKPSVLAYGASGFTIAFEDMGSIGDFDFNDVVLKVKPGRNGQVTLAAAGATYHIEVLYAGDPISWGGNVTEIHDAFGVDRKVMVNTGKNQQTEKTVNKDFGSASRKTISEKFTLKVNTEPDQPESQASVKYIQIANKTEGLAPQGFVVNSTNWVWPSERQRITDKYPSFLNWVQSQINVNWYQEEIILQ